MQIIKEQLDIEEILHKRIKNMFREILQIGNEKIKEVSTNKVKDYYDNEYFNKDNVDDITIDTTKEAELFDYADIDKFYTKENSF